MKNSQFNHIVCVLWLIAASLQAYPLLSGACAGMFIFHAILGLVWKCIELKAVKP